MAVLKGNITGSVSTIPFDIACKVISFWLVNRSGGTGVVNMYIATDDGDMAAIPVDLNMVSGYLYASDLPIIMKAGWYFIIVSNVSLDYFINVE